MEESSDTSLKSWLKKVIDVVYDMEDALDHFKLHLVRDRGHGFYASLLKITGCISSLQARHRIASEMLEIRSRVVDIAGSYRSYLMQNNIMEKDLNYTTSASHQPRTRETPSTSSLEEDNLVGIEGAKEQLINWLVRGKFDREVVSVVGMGGLGKSTLVKLVYGDAEVMKHFELRAWVTVSQSFKIEELLKDIIQQISRVPNKSADHLEMDSEGEDKFKLITAINEFLRQKRYLIVLDDVWDTYAFDAFVRALPRNNCGSRILLTTRIVTVATMKSPEKVYALNPLSPEDSWTLFCKKTFKNNSCPPHLKDVSEKILHRCEGLPLAIVAVSGVLATKDESREDQWEMIHRTLVYDDSMLNLRRVLSLSYNDLPYFLKSCLLYFSVFPQNYRIKSARLVRLWIAEGFVNEREGMTLEEVAEAYLNELIMRNLVQVVEANIDGRVKTCRIHELLHEIVISKARDQEFITIVKSQSKILPEKFRRVSFHDTTPSIRHIASQQLRSLLMFWARDSLSESPVFYSSFNHSRLLNVLDLEGAPLKEFPQEIVSLSLLKYLSLRDTKVNSIPRSIGKLQNLETLDLKHAHVTELPAEILELQKLRHLLVYRYQISSDYEIYTKNGFKAPALIGSQKSLQKLCFIEANQGGNLMQELGKLNNLRRLGIVKLREQDGMALCSSIEKLMNLRALSITSMNESEIIDLESLSTPPTFLQRLYLAGSLQKVPDWIPALDSLVKVVLKWSKLSDDPLLSLQRLPRLVHLELVQAYDGKEFYFQQKGFQSLKLLGLSKLERLEEIKVEKGAMPCLQKLIVQSCHSLQKVPLGIQYLVKLKLLEFINMPIELIMKMDPNGEHGDHWKVKHIPEVHFSYWNNGNWDSFSLNSFRDDKILPSPAIRSLAIKIFSFTFVM
ncbi:hypothetical protein GH714_027837 [Hevea brasiliensis]|uniref:NB-ARC domain-containing protein n=1 Tax=Hevea brasiliensis TaxID=3981 RepID=A0A6A6N504_HEVBR|nr:hypothetical protein GH714_027837 [Hevea brasiliensis]